MPNGQAEDALKPEILGVVAIIIDDKGAVLASAADFDKQRAGYVSLSGAQKDRALRAAWKTVISDYCWKLAPAIVEDWWLAERIQKTAVGKLGWKVEIRQIESGGNCPRMEE